MWEAARRLGVEGYLGKPIVTYSSGMKKRLLLLLALGVEAEVYLLDEPFTLVDAATRRIVAEEVVGLGESGRTVLLSTHMVEGAVLEAAVDVLCLEDGSVAGECGFAGVGRA